MKDLDESNKMMADDVEMDEEIEKQLETEARNNIANENTLRILEVKLRVFFYKI
jgi:trans-2-enoyl-CoA reductase